MLTQARSERISIPSEIHWLLTSTIQRLRSSTCKARVSSDKCSRLHNSSQSRTIAHERPSQNSDRTSQRKISLHSSSTTHSNMAKSRDSPSTECCPRLRGARSRRDSSHSTRVWTWSNWGLLMPLLERGLAGVNLEQAFSPKCSNRQKSLTTVS